MKRFLLVISFFIFFSSSIQAETATQTINPMCQLEPMDRINPQKNIPNANIDKANQEMNLLMNEIRLLSLKIEILEKQQLERENYYEQNEQIEQQEQSNEIKKEIDSTKSRYWDKIKRLGSILGSLGFNGALLGATVANFLIILINAWLNNLSLFNKNPLPTNPDSSTNDNCCCCCPCSPLQNQMEANQQIAAGVQLPQGTPTNEDLNNQLQDYLKSNPAAEKELTNQMSELYDQLPASSGWGSMIPKMFANHIIQYGVNIFMTILLGRLFYSSPIKTV